ncbi:cytochrome c oxidase subunit II [Sphingosinicella rhizophila]|uniref:Cytochrome aa3 subunit 2 n=1 Tax=Sphingosinicella rhizophila TaxID=3050082 RepID=A0ABU3Q683_9SPHN|nr:cytochrome c oxidase subunit II [Sphingosinicella sp. GR2756]MDT9598926.1 cytochrome c oxidase subunit II [Sphingosinicella sp. GR2756]
MFDPAGPFAGSIATLAWILMGVAAVVMLVVAAALWVALFGTGNLRSKLGGKRTIWLGGILFPMVVLTALLVYGLSLTRNLTAPIRGDEMRVRLVGEMWWWRVAYLDRRRQPFMMDANELHIPTGRPVVLELQSSDVVHSFWVPRLSGKLDMVPGRTNIMRIQADQPGTFGGQCAEYCGGPHALMGFVVIAHEPEAFAAWLRARQEPQEAAISPEAARGASLFMSTGCAACHRIAGTGANGLAGPDLSHIGSRRTLGAGILPNNRGALMGWIGNAQALKPGNRMPPYTILPGKDLQAIAAYLETKR